MTGWGRRLRSDGRERVELLWYRFARAAVSGLCHLFWRVRVGAVPRKWTSRVC